jgi:hypothetical protein
MQRLFGLNPPAQEPEKKITLSRLHEILSPSQQPAGQTEDTSPPETQEATAPDRPRPIEITSIPPVLRTGAAIARAASEESPALPLPSSEDNNAAPVREDFLGFAEQFTRTFLDALAGAVAEVHRFATEDRRNLERVLETFDQNANEIDRLRQTVASLEREIGSLVGVQQEMSARLAGSEQDSRQLAALNDEMKQVRRGLEERLEVQAGAIRTLHAAVNAKEQRLVKLLTTFQTLQQGAEEPGLSRLPDKL